GEEALGLFDKHHPDLVLLDIGMPVMNGYELARHIRQHPYGKVTYLVALTGWGKDEDRYRSKEAGIDLHLVKPAETSALMTILTHPSLRKSAQSGPATHRSRLRRVPHACMAVHRVEARPTQSCKVTQNRREFGPVQIQNNFPFASDP